MSAQHTPDDPEVISWDVAERLLTDGSAVFDVVGTSDQCKVTFYCADEATAENLANLLNGRTVCGSLAERLVGGAKPVTKTCTRCREDLPADTEFFRLQPNPNRPNRLAPWCRACEAEQKAEVRQLAKAAIAKATGSAA